MQQHRPTITERHWRAIEAADRRRREIEALMKPGHRHETVEDWHGKVKHAG